MYEPQESLEKLAIETVGNVCACLYEHGYEKCEPGDLHSIQLGRWLRNIEIQEIEDQEQETDILEMDGPEQQINTHIKSIAIKFCIRNYGSIRYHINQLNKLRISSKLIKNSELYNLATKCVVQEFNRERAAKNYGNALNVIDIAKNLDIKIPEDTEKICNIIEDSYIH